MSVFKTPEGKEIPFTSPRDTGGMLREAPRSPGRCLPGPSSLFSLVNSGTVGSMEAGAAGAHSAILGVRTRKESEVMVGQTGGESNRVMPNRASFSAAPQRGDEYVHIPT